MPQVSSGLHGHQGGTSSHKGGGDEGHTTVENLWKLSKEACSIPKSTRGDETTYTWGKGKGKKRISKQLKKACKTRWLSFDNAIAAVCSDLLSILQTLHQLKADPSCYDLLKKLMKVKKIGTIYILCEVLPVLSDLSRVFQSLFARRKFPHLLRANLRQDNLAEGGTLAVNEIKFSSKDTEYLENLFKNYVNGLVRKVTKRLRCDSSSHSDASIWQNSHTTSREWWFHGSWQRAYRCSGFALLPRRWS